jgi:hypothetical protein
MFYSEVLEDEGQILLEFLPQLLFIWTEDVILGFKCLVHRNFRQSLYSPTLSFS